MPRTYTPAVSESASTPIPIDSPRLRPRLRSAYRNPTSRTTNDAPSREPDSIVKVCSWLVAPPTYRLSATAAIGEPDSTMYAPSHPNPSVETALLKSGLSSSVGASAFAPSFISWIANTNRNSAAANVASLSATRITLDPDPAGAVACSGAAVASAMDVPAVGVGSDSA